VVVGGGIQFCIESGVRKQAHTLKRSLLLMRCNSVLGTEHTSLVVYPIPR
jgi:hypothetical protein